ncbi:MAG: hypothetical protein H7Y59_08235 [Anaerolineales bacterium]|nr:hypothetical protein [Anaerolineales bacterium]
MNQMTTSFKAISTQRITNIILWIGILAATSALFVYMYIGLFTRYLADDYCLLIDLQSGNIVNASWEKYLFSSNRFSNLFVLGFWELLGPNNIAYIPALLIVLWVLGLFWLFNELTQLFDLKLKFPIVLLFAELLAIFSFYTAPSLFQSVYWRSGQVTYFTPLVFFALLAAWMTRIIRLQSPRSLTWQMPLFGFLAFFIGGLSETMGAFHISILLLAIMGVFFFDKSSRRKPALSLLVATLVGAFAALLAMFLSPANALRINPEIPTPNFIELITRSLQYAFSFIESSFKTLPTPSLFTFLISALASFALFSEQSKKDIHPRFWLAFILIPLITYGLLIAIVAPSAYGQSYPVERVRFPAHFVFTAALLSLGICFGYYISQLKLPNFAHGFALALLTLSILYPFWTSRSYIAQIPYMHRWSAYWDERVIYIEELKSEGQTDLRIPALSGFFNTKELDIRENFWVNQCAAQYYGVNSISAITAPDSP